MRHFQVKGGADVWASMRMKGQVRLKREVGSPWWPSSSSAVGSVRCCRKQPLGFLSLICSVRILSLWNAKVLIFCKTKPREAGDSFLSLWSWARIKRVPPWCCSLAIVQSVPSTSQALWPSHLLSSPAVCGIHCCWNKHLLFQHHRLLKLCCSTCPVGISGSSPQLLSTFTRAFCSVTWKIEAYR